MIYLGSYPAGSKIDLDDVHDALTVELGISKPDTLKRHLRTMINLGYLESVSGGSLTSPPTFKIGPRGRRVLEEQGIKPVRTGKYRGSST